MKTRQEDGRSTERSRLAEKYHLKHPTLGNQTIGRMLWVDYPKLFTDVEAGRSVMRDIRGVRGRKRTHTSLPTYSIVRQEDLQADDSWETPYKIADSIKRLGVISDLHGIYLDKQAFDLAIHTLEKEKVESLLINGDLMDQHWLGRWAKKPGTKSFKEELSLCTSILSQLSKRFKNVYFKEGNHDNWMERGIRNNLPALADVTKLTLPEILELRENNIHHIHNLQEIKFGDLSILHGHEKPGFFTPQLVAKSVITWWQAYKREPGIKIMVSHFHTVDNFIQRDHITGTFAYGYVTGCLAKLKMDYHPYARRNHGIAIVDNHKGETEVRNFEI